MNEHSSSQQHLRGMRLNPEGHGQCNGSHHPAVKAKVGEKEKIYLESDHAKTKSELWQSLSHNSN